MSAYTEIARLGVKIVADGTVYTRTMRAAVATADWATSRLTSAGKAMSLAITTPLAGLGAYAVRTFRSFNDQMTKSTSIMGNLSKEMRAQLEQTAIAISGRGRLSADVLAGAYYELASAGLSAEQSMRSLNTVADFATAGNFDLAKATNLLAGSMGALGLEANQTNIQRIADILTQAGNLEAAAPEQFAEALVTKSAGAMRLLNKEVEEGMAVLMAYARVGVKAQNAGEKLDILWRDMASANIKHREAWDKLNIKVFDTAGNFRHTADILQDMERVLGKMSAEEKKATLLGLGMTDMSMSATTTLLGMSQQIRENEKNLNAHNVVQDVAARQMASFDAQADKLKNTFDNTARVIGTALVPTIQKMIGYVSAAHAYWEGLSGQQKQNAITIGILASMAGPALLGIAAAVKVVGMGFSAFNAVMFVSVRTFRGVYAGYRLLVAGTQAVVTGIATAVTWIMAEWKAYVAAQASKAAAAAAVTGAIVAGNVAQAGSYGAASTAAGAYSMVLAGTTSAVAAKAQVEAIGIGTTALAVRNTALATTTSGANTIATISNSGALAINTAAKASNTATTAIATSSNIIYTTATTVNTAATAANTVAVATASSWYGKLGAWVLRGAGTLLTFGKGLGSVSAGLVLVKGFVISLMGTFAAMALPVVVVVAKIVAVVALVGAAVAGVIYLLTGGGGLSEAWNAVKETLYGFYIKATEWLGSIWKGIKGFLGFTAESAKGMDDASAAAKKAGEEAEKAMAEAAKAAEEATAAQAKMTEQLKGVEGEMKKLTEASGEGANGFQVQTEAAKDLDKRIQDLTKDLQNQNATFGQSNHQQDIARLKMDGATDAQLAAAKAAADALDVKEKEKDAQEKLKEKMEEGKRMMEQYMTPAEKMAKAHMDLSKMLEIGAIDMETYNRGMKAAKAEFGTTATAQLRVQGVEGVKAGTAEALQHLMAYRAGAAKLPTGVAESPLKNVPENTALAAKQKVAADAALAARTAGDKSKNKVIGKGKDKPTAQDKSLMVASVSVSSGGGADSKDTKKHQNTTEELLRTIAMNTGNQNQPQPANF